MTRRFARLSALAASSLLVLGGATRAAAGSFPIPPPDAERRFASQPFEILEAKRTASGVAGAQRWKLRFRDGTVVKAKWKAAPRHTTDTWNNSPWREIAAYEIQKWFLDPADYVVPPSELRCVPLDVYQARIDEDARPTLVRTSCVLGVLSLWLQDVEEPPAIWRPDLFEQGGYYRESIAAVDVLTLLIAHKDGRPANFLWSTDGRHQVFSIDNGVSFGMFPFNPLVKNWHGLRVPALSKKVIDRLDHVGPEQIARLGVLRHMEPDADGVLTLREGAANLDPDRAVRRHGTTLQIGLSRADLGRVEERIDRLIRLTSNGEIPLF